LFLALFCVIILPPPRVGHLVQTPTTGGGGGSATPPSPCLAPQCVSLCSFIHEVSSLLDGPPGRGPREYASQKGGFFGLTPWLRGKSPPLLLLEWCCHAGSRVHPIGDTLCSREGARALFAVKSSNCRIFGIYPEMGAFLDRGMDCFPYSMDTRV